MAGREELAQWGPTSFFGLVVLYIFFGAAGSTPPQAAAETSTPKSAVPNALQPSITDLLPNPVPDPDTAADQPTVFRPPAIQVSELLIATIPDPVSSSSGWLADRYLDAIQRGIEASDWILDRYWLPWAPPADPQNSNTPGVLVFRKPLSDRAMVVFLVGESPTAGINPLAFREALRLRSQIWWFQATPNPLTLKILGPSFSGSSKSLALELGAWAERQYSLPPIKIISGSATSRTNKDILEKSAPGASFQATVIDHEEMWSQVTSLIAQFDESGSKRIAVLSETNTTFGTSINRTLGSDPALVLPFPLHISALRRAYGSDDKSKKTTAADETEANMLDLALDGGSADDLLPALAPQMTSRSTELVLKNTLETIYRERIRYVGLAATDPRDKLFLARRIRTYCPDVKLFTIEADILFLHPHFAKDFEGMLILSSYPLSDSSRVATSHVGQHRLLQFSSSEAAGVYNATRALLDAKDGYADYLPDSGMSSASSTISSRPRIWFSQVGSAGFWPISVLPNPDTAHYVHSVEGKREVLERDLGKYRKQVELPLAYTVLLLLLSVALVFFCWEYLKKKTYVFPEYFFRETHRQSYTFFLALILTGMTLFLAYPWLLRGGAALTARPDFADRMAHWPITVVPFVVAGAIAVLAVATLIRSGSELFYEFFRSRGRKWADNKVDADSRNRTLQRFASVGYFFLFVILAVLIADHFEHAAEGNEAIAAWGPGEIARLHTVLYLRRLTQLTGGLSLLMPIVAVAFGLCGWCVYSLRRLHLERLFAEDQNAALLGLFVPGAQGCLQRIHDDVTGTGWRGPTWKLMIPVLGVTWLAPSFVLWLRALPTFEDPVFDYVIRISAWILYLLVLLSAMKFASHWNYFKKFLDQFAAHPAAAAVADLKPEIARPLRALLWSDATTPKEEQAWDNLRGSIFDRAGIPPNASAQEIFEKITAYEKTLGSQGVHELIAASAARLIREVFAHLRNHLGYLLLGFLLLIFAVSSYPFQPQRLLMFIAVTMTMPMSAMLIIVFVQMDRDEILSRMSGSTPGKVTWDLNFFTRIVLYGVIPLASLFSTDVPGIRKLASVLGEVIQKALP